MGDRKAVMQTLSQLQSQFPGVLLIKPAAAGLVIGLKPQSTYNRLVAGRFPLPVVQTGFGKMVRLSDLSEFIDNLNSPSPAITPAATAAPVKGRGRPSKAETIEAARRGMSVRELRAQSSLAGV